MKRVLLPLGVVALVLSGCSGSDGSEPAVSPSSAAPSSAAPSPSATEEAVTLGPGSFTFETPDGAVGMLEVPGAAPVDIEELRTMAGAEPVTYLTGNLDNREGMESFDAYMVSVFDLDGRQYTYTPASEYINEIRPSDASAEVYNQYIELGNALMGGVDPLERADFVMVGPELPAEIAGITITSGMEDYPVTPK